MPVTVPDADGSEAHDSRADGLGWRAALLVFVAVVTVHCLSPSVQIGDSRLSVPVADQLLHHGTLDLSGASQVTGLADKYDVREKRGRLLPYFPWPPMLLALPGTIAATAVGKDPATLRPSKPNQTWVVEIPTASVLVALTAVVLALIAFDLVPGSRRKRQRFAIVIALVYAFATGAWSTGSRALWQHTPSMLFLTVALLCALRIDRQRWWSMLLGGALAAAYTMRPSDAVAVGCFVVWLAVTHRTALLRVSIGMAIVAVPFVAVNLATYRAVLPPYYSGTRLGSEASIGFVDTALMYLFSPSRGLLIYDPTVVLAAVGLVLKLRRRQFTTLDGAVCAAVVGHWLVIASFGSSGGSSYGPRYMTDVLPFLVYLAIPALVAIFGNGFRNALSRRRVATVACVVLLGWSVVVNATGAVLRSAYCWSATPVQVDDRPSRIWDWGDPQFFRPVADLRDGESVHDVVLGSCRNA